MRKMFVLISVILYVSLFLANIQTSNSQSFYAFVWNPEHSRVNIKLDYPKEAHRGDIITYVLDGFWWTNKTVDEFDFYISYFRDDGTWHTLLSRNLFSGGVPVKEDEELHYSFEVEVPMHTAYVPYNMHLGISIRTDGSPLLDILEIYTTQIVRKTRTELQSENSELSYNYTSLKQSHDDYEQTHSYSNSEYNSLNSSYNSLESSYNSLQDDYNELKSKYQAVGEPLTIRNLMYLFLITTIVFIATTAYFAVRKPKVKAT